MSQVLYLSLDSHQELCTFKQTKWQCFKCFILPYPNFRSIQFFVKGLIFCEIKLSKNNFCNSISIHKNMIVAIYVASYQVII